MNRQTATRDLSLCGVLNAVRHDVRGDDVNDLIWEHILKETLHCVQRSNVGLHLRFCLLFLRLLIRTVPNLAIALTADHLIPIDIQ
jgi:hypothetical protein